MTAGKSYTIKSIHKGWQDDLAGKALTAKLGGRETTY